MKAQQTTRRAAFLLILFAFVQIATGLSMHKEIYGITGSGWTSPQWNWGYGQGTGHDCALICRQQFRTTQARATLVQSLLDGDNPPNAETNAEEIKLILALAWQRGQWDGSDGGEGGYGQVLAALAAAQRYEVEDGLRQLTADMADPERFRRLGTSDEDVAAMVACASTDHTEEGFRQCSGMVLRAMGFVEQGL
jgi:hypothetical protein